MSSSVKRLILEKSILFEVNVTYRATCERFRDWIHGWQMLLTAPGGWNQDTKTNLKFSTNVIATNSSTFTIPCRFLRSLMTEKRVMMEEIQWATQVKSHFFGGFWYIPSRISSQQEQVWMERWEFVQASSLFSKILLVILDWCFGETFGYSWIPKTRNPNHQLTHSRWRLIQNKPSENWIKCFHTKRPLDYLPKNSTKLTGNLPDILNR